MSASSVCSVNSTFRFGGSDIAGGTQSITCSKKFICKLFQVSVINILYNRFEIPDAMEKFQEEYVRDIKLMVCRKGVSRDPLICKYYQWIKGATHAFNKGYLKEFYLLFKNKDGVLLEHYVFSFDYSCDDDKENIEGSGKDSEILYKICKRIFDDIKRLGKYKKWDENNTFDAELVYNDNVPLHYRPPHFEDYLPTDIESSGVYAIKNMQIKSEMVKLNDITTGFHTLKCCFSGKIFSSTSSIASSASNFYSETDKTSITIPSSKSSTITKISVEYTDDTFCICKSTVKHKSIKTIECSICNQPCHAACFGYLEIPKDFRCLDCGGSANIPKVINIDKVKFFRIRLLVAFCYFTMELPNKIMKGFNDKRDRNHLWSYLDDLDIFVKKNNRYCVNHTRVTEAQFLKTLFGNQFIPDSMQLVDLTNDDSEDEEMEEPPAKKSKC